MFSSHDNDIIQLATSLVDRETQEVLESAMSSGMTNQQASIKACKFAVTASLYFMTEAATKSSMMIVAEAMRNGRLDTLALYALQETLDRATSDATERAIKSVKMTLSTRNALIRKTGKTVEELGEDLMRGIQKTCIEEHVEGSFADYEGYVHNLDADDSITAEDVISFAGNNS